MMRWLKQVFANLAAHYCHVYRWPTLLATVGAICFLFNFELGKSPLVFFFLLAAAVALTSLLVSRLLGKLSEFWPSIDVEVVAQHVEDSGVLCSYDYHVAGRDYAGTLISYSSTLHSEWLKEQRLLGADLEKSGPQVVEAKLYYCPQAPGLSCLRPGNRFGDVVACLSLLSVVALGLCWLRFWG